MATGTGIEWTDATWNPIRGCSRVSEGCRNCYAEKVAYRFSDAGQAYHGLVGIGGKWNGQIRFVEEHLLDPLKWKKPRRIFVNSMSDLFHENVTDEMLDRIFAVMALCPQHTFQVLTKRPARMLAYLSDKATEERTSRASVFIVPNAELSAKGIEPDWQQEVMAGWARWPLPNVWLGVSVENQKAADWRIPLLLQTPAAKRFISAEPLLGRVNLRSVKWTDGYEDIWFANVLGASDMYHDGEGDVSDGPERCGLDWVIVGGESGPGARPMHPDWARSLCDQCVTAGVPFFFKQWGEFASVSEVAGRGAHHAFADGATVRRIGKKAAGDLLDGKQWHQFPGVSA